MKANRNVLLGIIFATAAIVLSFAPFPPAYHTFPKLRTFKVLASQFGYLPSNLYVDPGDTVVIQLVSMDVIHGLYIDGYDISVEAEPGQSRTLTFVANEPGAFRFRCSVNCGAMHPFMLGKLNVGVNTTLVRGVGLSLLAVLGVITFANKKLIDE